MLVKPILLYKELCINFFNYVVEFIVLRKR